MTETIKRNLTFEIQAPEETTKRIESDCYVEGYATTFNKYELCRAKDYTIYEQFKRDAFDSADMSDVILQYDHEGSVFARTSNGSLGLEVDDNGLFIWADLSRTSKARSLYEDIKAGNVNKMSIRCSVDADFDGDNFTNIINRVKKVIDVSAVSIPANDGTEIVARSADRYLKNKERKEREKLALMLELERNK